MRKIHVIFKKEDIQPNKLIGKQGVVFDVLMATSIITFLLSKGARGIYPVENEQEARRKCRQMPNSRFQLVGEDQGAPIKDFLLPSTTLLQNVSMDLPFILSTTNGTVALRRSRKAKRLFASSLLNNKYVAEVLVESKEDIIIICAGSSGSYNMEDFLGAGHLIEHLVELEQFDLTDAAKTALFFYQGKRGDVMDVLKETRIGQIFMKYGLDAEIDYVSRVNTERVIPIVQPDGWIVNQVNVGVRKG